MSATHQQAQARAENERAITEMCSLARQPERAAAFIASGKNRTTVLAELRTDQDSGRGPPRNAAAASLASMRRELSRAGHGHDGSASDDRASGTAAMVMTSMQRELARAGLRSTNPTT